MLICSLICTHFNVERAVKCIKGENYSEYTFFSSTLVLLDIHTLLSRFPSIYSIPVKFRLFQA